MGIKDLLSVLAKKYAEVVLKDMKLAVFSGLKLGVDVSIYAYKYMAVSRKDACKYLDVSKSDPPPHVLRSYWLEKYYQLAVALLELDITPVMVFDGPAFRLKMDTREDRMKEYLKREAEIKELRSNLSNEPNQQMEDELKKKLEHHVSFNSGDWEALEKLFIAMGLPVIKANFEAEAVCARLVRKGLISGVITNDGDVLAHNGGIMISDVKRSYRRDQPTHTCTCIILSEVLRVLQLSQTEFVDMCILMGTDYNDNVPNYGFAKTFPLLKKYGDVHAVVDFLATKVDLKDSVISRLAERIEIKGYFENDLDCVPKVPLVVSYPYDLRNHLNAEVAQHDLKATLTEIFSGYNRNRMLEGADKTIKMLTEFNQKFAALQTFEVRQNS